VFLNKKYKRRNEILSPLVWMNELGNENKFHNFIFFLHQLKNQFFTDVIEQNYA